MATSQKRACGFKRVTIVAALFGLAQLGMADDGVTEDMSAPQNLALSRCWEPSGHLDFGDTYRVYHFEIFILPNIGSVHGDGSSSEMIFSSGAAGRQKAETKMDRLATLGNLQDSVELEIDLLNEQGSMAVRCHRQHTSADNLQYACNGQGRRLLATGRGSGRIAVCDTAVWGEPVNKAHRSHLLADALYKNGSMESLQGCVRLSRARAAGGDESFKRLLAACTNDAGAIWLRKGEHSRALRLFRRALPLTQDHPIIILNIVSVARKLCDWSHYDEESSLVQDCVERFNHRRAALMNPYLIETYGIQPPAILKMVTALSDETFASVHHPNATTSLSLLVPTLAPLHVLDTNQAGGAKVVRIGYYSLTGLNAGGLSIGRFLQSVLALHGHPTAAAHLEAYCYGEQPNDDGSVIYQTLSEGCFGRRVLDTHLLSFADKARRLRSDSLHIFVDLSGFTHGASFTPIDETHGVSFRSSIHRLMAIGMAPIQVSWWGYTGTLGAEFVHYVATDVRSSPPEQVGYYSEKMLYVPGSTYLVSDHIISRREVHQQHPAQNVHVPQWVPARSASAAGLGVPSRESVLQTGRNVSLVFCSFNQFYKVYPEIWQAWMRVLLESGPDSVLWMLEFDGDSVSNLVEEAVIMGVAGWRIVVTSLLPIHREFLSKGICDLYLDTPRFNAHTTAKDALWSGVPVLTLAGEGMASRVAASLTLLLDPAAVTIARNLADYMEIGLRLAARPRVLARLKERVRKLRWTSTVFDTVGWMRLWQRQLRNTADLVAAGYFPPAHMHLL